VRAFVGPRAHQSSPCLHDSKAHLPFRARLLSRNASFLQKCAVFGRSLRSKPCSDMRGSGSFFLHRSVLTFSIKYVSWADPPTRQNKDVISSSLSQPLDPTQSRLIVMPPSSSRRNIGLLHHASAIAIRLRQPPKASSNRSEIPHRSGPRVSGRCVLSSILLPYRGMRVSASSRTARNPWSRQKLLCLRQHRASDAAFASGKSPPRRARSSPAQDSHQGRLARAIGPITRCEAPLLHA